MSAVRPESAARKENAVLRGIRRESENEGALPSQKGPRESPPAAAGSGRAVMFRRRFERKRRVFRRRSATRVVPKQGFEP